jgi:flagellar M-ring protein FliF
MVVEAPGRVLSAQRGAADPTTGTSDAALEYQRALERSLAERVEAMLGTVVGRDGVIAQVAATVDFARVERTEESWDPDRAAIREARETRETTRGPRATGGVAGAQANLTNDPAVVAEEDEPRVERRDETQKWEVSKVTSHTVAPAGAVRQLSVAVLVDGTYREENGARIFVPRTEAELERLRELVKSAVGASDVRGDRVETTSAPFEAEGAPSGGGVLAEAAGSIGPFAARFAAVGLVVALLFWFVRPLVLALAQGRGRRDDELLAGELPQGLAQLTRQNLTLTQRNPERAAQLVRQWLQEGESQGLGR